MKVCNRCVMNNSSDNTISFDSKGNCNYCNTAIDNIKKVYFPNKKGKEKLENIINKIKLKGKNKKYDCSMGISGGLDSSYLLYLGDKWGLRILGFHIDDGFDTEITKKNIEKLINKTKIDLIVIKPNEFQYNELIKAYLRAGVPNLAVPQDNILFANLCKYSKSNNINYFLSGGNFATECILQQGNTHSYLDFVNIKDINKKYGKSKIDKLDFISNLNKKILSYKYNFEEIRPLNYTDYNQMKAFKELNDFCGFEYYGSKHLENIFTAFLQLYWLPKKFNVDKRTSHLSSLIVSGQMTREEALKELSKPLYDDIMMNSYIQFIKDKFRISDAEFEELMKATTHQHTDFKTDKLFEVLGKIKRKLLGNKS